MKNKIGNIKKNIGTKNVLVFGVFDILHDGHRFFLQKARELGTPLVAVVTPDEVVKKMKGRNPHQSEETRRIKLVEENLADEVIIGDRNSGSWDIFKRVHPHTIACGYDQTDLLKALKKEKKERRSTWRLVHIPPYKDGALHSSNLL